MFDTLIVLLYVFVIVGIIYNLIKSFLKFCKRESIKEDIEQKFNHLEYKVESIDFAYEQDLDERIDQQEKVKDAMLNLLEDIEDLINESRG